MWNMVPYPSLGWYYLPSMTLKWWEHRNKHIPWPQKCVKIRLLQTRVDFDLHPPDLFSSFVSFFWLSPPHEPLDTTCFAVYAPNSSLSLSLSPSPSLSLRLKTHASSCPHCVHLDVPEAPHTQWVPDEVLAALQACVLNSWPHLRGGCPLSLASPWCPVSRVCWPCSLLPFLLPSPLHHLQSCLPFLLERNLERLPKKYKGFQTPLLSFPSHQHPVSSLGHDPDLEIYLGTILLMFRAYSDFTNFSISLVFLLQGPIQHPLLLLVSS